MDQTNGNMLHSFKPNVLISVKQVVGLGTASAAFNGANQPTADVLAVGPYIAK